MSSFLFYDPDNNHEVAVRDQDIVPIYHIDVLKTFITTNNNLQQIVCICSANKSAVIEDIIKDKPHIVSIYVCKNNNHHQRETNPVFNSKVNDNIQLAENSGWEVKGRIALLERCIQFGFNTQAHNEIQILKRII